MPGIGDNSDLASVLRGLMYTTSAHRVYGVGPAQQKGEVKLGSGN